MAGSPIRIGGDGTPYRSYLYAADLAIWLWTILFKGKSLRPYNVGSEEDYSIASLALIVNEALGGNSLIEIARSPEPNSSPSRYVPAVARALTELELACFIPLAESLRRTRQWYQANNAI